MPSVRSALRRGAGHVKRRATPLAAKFARPFGWGQPARRVRYGACPPSGSRGCRIAPRAAALLALRAQWARRAGWLP